MTANDGQSGKSPQSNWIKKALYSRSNSIVAGVVVFFLFLWCLIAWRLSGQKKEVPHDPQLEALQARIELYQSELDSIESPVFETKKAASQEVLVDLQIDPNSSDSALLSAVLGARAARSVIAYRSHGGIFRSLEDLKKIYNIDTARVNHLRDLISFNSALQKEDAPKYAKKEYFALDINCANDSLLAQFPSIGPSRAKAINEYGARLGGYYSISQLREVECLDAQLIDSLAVWGRVDTTKIKRIKVNFASIAAMRKHPYISFLQAKQIYELRNDNVHKGYITLSDTASLTEFTPAQREKVLHYLDFTKTR